jgi:hypothetical protein
MPRPNITSTAPVYESRVKVSSPNIITIPETTALKIALLHVRGIESHKDGYRGIYSTGIYKQTIPI